MFWFGGCEGSFEHVKYELLNGEMWNVVKHENVLKHDDAHSERYTVLVVEITRLHYVRLAIY